jgi:hypothetical protein
LVLFLKTKNQKDFYFSRALTWDFTTAPEPDELLHVPENQLPAKRRSKSLFASFSSEKEVYFLA